MQNNQAKVMGTVLAFALMTSLSGCSSVANYQNETKGAIGNAMTPSLIKGAGIALQYDRDAVNTASSGPVEKTVEPGTVIAEHGIYRNQLIFEYEEAFSPNVYNPSDRIRSCLVLDKGRYGFIRKIIIGSDADEETVYAFLAYDLDGIGTGMHVNRKIPKCDLDLGIGGHIYNFYDYVHNDETKGATIVPLEDWLLGADIGTEIYDKQKDREDFINYMEKQPGYGFLYIENFEDHLTTERIPDPKMPYKAVTYDGITDDTVSVTYKETLNSNVLTEERAHLTPDGQGVYAYKGVTFKIVKRQGDTLALSVLTGIEPESVDHRAEVNHD